jgi:hypothetical protein
MTKVRPGSARAPSPPLRCGHPGAERDADAAEDVEHEVVPGGQHDQHDHAEVGAADRGGECAQAAVVGAGGDDQGQGRPQGPRGVQRRHRGVGVGRVRRRGDGVDAVDERERRPLHACGAQLGASSFG